MGAQPRRGGGESIRVVAGQRREHGVGRLDALATRRPLAGRRATGRCCARRAIAARRRSSGPPKACMRQHDAGEHVVAGRREARAPTPEQRRDAAEIVDAGGRSRHAVEQVVATPARADRSAPGKRHRRPAVRRHSRRRPRRQRPDVDARHGPRCRRRPAIATSSPAATAGSASTRRCSGPAGPVTVDDHQESAGPSSTWMARENTARTRTASVRHAPPRRPDVEADHDVSRGRAPSPRRRSTPAARRRRRRRPARSRRTRGGRRS